MIKYTQNQTKPSANQRILVLLASKHVLGKDRVKSTYESSGSSGQA